MERTVDLQPRFLRILASAQVLLGIGTASTVAAGSLLMAKVTGSESLAGLAQTFSVIGAAILALPLARLTMRGGRRLALTFGYGSGVVGATLAVLGGITELWPLILLGTLFVGGAAAAGYQARFAATDLADDSRKAQDLSYVVWGSTIGAVLGPNLMQPMSNVAQALNIEPLVGPYLLASMMFLFSALIAWVFLRPDPYLLAAAKSELVQRVTLLETWKWLQSHPIALFAIASVAIGHVAMVSIMVMTPVHMAHVDVELNIIGFIISIHVLGMYAFSPLVGRLVRRTSALFTIQLGVLTLLISALVSGVAEPTSVPALGLGLFLLGLGWSATLIAGSALLALQVPTDFKASSQGVSDLAMNTAGAIGGAVAGLIIAYASYGWLCVIASIPVAALGIRSLTLTRRARTENIR